ncbi:hypothetical protein [Chryseolinea sp. H1M3-3]|uniref:hypothetical protein n=1 Tax=Chryseolinea sp. H1M3-3 TaxID=3034144 RepID=UPI0023EC8011|nr:hypothetical protein [Chryseolinea sp. H1M3-3]
MRGIIVTIFVLSFSYSGGQTFKAEAALPAIEKDDFYRIVLSPQIGTHLNDVLSDIRIYNKKGLEVPYILQQELPNYYQENFIEYEILEKDSKPGCCTSLLLRNAKKNPINNIHLKIKNADAWREASLLGSDDQKKWFAIKDYFALSAPGGSQETEEIKLVGFPWSNYEFYLLKISDSALAPLNILKVGYYESETSTGKFTELPVGTHASDSAVQKKTYVRLALSSLQFIDKLEVVVSGAKYYRRNATVLEKRIRISKNGQRSGYYKPIKKFELTSGRTAFVELYDTRAQELVIEIENEDNPPLTIADVKAFQLNRYLTAWLDHDDQYVLKFGDPELTPPVYDLSFFRDSIPAKSAMLEVHEIKFSQTVSEETPHTFFTSKTIIWVAIALVTVVLGFMSIKLVRETAKERTK